MRAFGGFVLTGLLRREVFPLLSPINVLFSLLDSAFVLCLGSPKLSARSFSAIVRALSEYGGLMRISTSWTTLGFTLKIWTMRSKSCGMRLVPQKIRHLNILSFD